MSADEGTIVHGCFCPQYERGISRDPCPLHGTRGTFNAIEDQPNVAGRSDEAFQRQGSLFDDVGAFHRKFNLPVAGQTRLATIPYGDFRYRVAFMNEELAEFIEAYGRDDLAAMADALADLVWVALGTAHYLGVPFDEVWAEVRQANLAKRPWQEGDAVKPRNVARQEIVKPAGWRAPDVRGVLERYAYKRRQL